MKLETALITATLAATMAVSTLHAQNFDGGRRGGPPGQDGDFSGQGQGRGFGGQRGQGQGGPGGGFRPPPHPLMTALDANNDNRLTKDEIANAASALAKLDKDGDGILSESELRPQFGGRGGMRGPSGPGGPSGQGGPGGNTMRGGEGRPGGGGDSNRGGGADFASMIMANDQNGDGKVTRDELPERMQRIIERVDTDKDGAISQAEANAMSSRFGGSRQGGRGNEGGGRPERPNRPEIE